MMAGSRYCLGERGGEFDKVLMDTFQLVVHGAPVSVSVSILIEGQPYRGIKSGEQGNSRPDQGISRSSQRVTTRYVHKLFEREGLTFLRLCSRPAAFPRAPLSE
jgi:hypothetical protein